MNRDLRNAIWLLVGFVLGGWVSSSYAALQWFSVETDPTPYPSAAAVCDAAIATYPPSYDMQLLSIVIAPEPYTSGVCKTTNGQISITFTGLCENGQRPLSDGTCGEVCPASGTPFSSGLYDLGTNEAASPTSVACSGGCEVTYSGSGIVARQLVNGVYHYFSEGSYDHTGQTCSGGASPSTAVPELPPPDCDSATQDAGTVNGSFVCINKTTTTTTTTAPPVTNPDGSTTQTTTTTDQGAGTQTTTTTTTAPDGTQTSTTTTSPIPGTESTFCQNNPEDPTCKKDDIPWGEIPSMGLIPVHKVEVETAYDVMGGEGMCPADETVDFMGQTLTWSYGPICTFAEAVRPLVIGLAWLSFGLIIVGAFGRK